MKETAQWDEIREARRRAVRFWLWERDVHVTLFVYSHNHIWVWIMCSCYPYRLRPQVLEDRYPRCSFVLEAHSRMFAHEYMDIIPVLGVNKALIEDILKREGERKDIPDRCPIG